jgi:hypothetical protein
MILAARPRGDTRCAAILPPPAPAAAGRMMQARTPTCPPMSNVPMRLSAPLRSVIALLAAALAGCASIATEVTVLDPAQKFAPTENVLVLLDYPPPPFVKIALIEAHGGVGDSELALLEEARRRARALGADAVVRLEVSTDYQPPVRVYDPAFASTFYPRYRYPYRSFYYPPYAFPPFPYDNYRWIPGGNVQTLKAVAIKVPDGRPAAP